MNTQAPKLIKENGSSWLVLLAALLSAVLLVGFSGGHWFFSPGAWLGPVFFIRFIRDERLRRGYLLVLAGCIVADWIRWFGILPLPLPIFLLIFALYGLTMSLPYLADRLLAPRIKGFASTLVFPLAATSVEFLNSLFNPFGSWGAVGYSVRDNLPLMQIISLTGMAGLVFLVSWFASVANWAWENRARGRALIPGIAMVAAIFLAVILYGAFRLAFAPLPSQTVRVAGITAEPVKGMFILWEHQMPDEVSARAQVEAIREKYFAETIREARAGAKIIQWPEAAGIGLPADEPPLLERARAVARQEHIYLAIPIYIFHHNDGRRNENRLALITPDGQIGFDHVKFGGNFIEGSLRGDGQLSTTQTPYGLLSGIICWDADFPSVVHQAGQAGVSLLLVPSNDWLEITPMHGEMAVFRAIENGLTIMRQTDHGLSIVADPYGRVLAQVNYYATTDRTMVAQVPLEHVPTLYARFGDWFGWLAITVFAVVLVKGVFYAR